MIEDETPTGEHDHNYQNVDDEEIRRERRSFRTIAWIVSAVVALVLVLLPVLQVVDIGGDDSNRDAAASEARALVANRFTEAVFVQQSVDTALQWSSPDLRDEIELTIQVLERRPSSEFAGARVMVARVDCDPAPADGECFQSWIGRAGAADLIRMSLVVAIVNGNARVVQLERINAV